MVLSDQQTLAAVHQDSAYLAGILCRRIPTDEEIGDYVLKPSIRSPVSVSTWNRSGKLGAEKSASMDPQKESGVRVVCPTVMVEIESRAADDVYLWKRANRPAK